MDAMQNTGIHPLLSGYYEPREGVSRPQVYAWQEEATREHIRSHLQGTQRGNSWYGTGRWLHSEGGLDVIYSSDYSGGKAAGSVGHQAIGNALWREDALWQTTVQGTLAFDTQAMISRGVALPQLVSGLPADLYVVVRKLGTGPVGCRRLALGIEWAADATPEAQRAADVPLSGAVRPINATPTWAHVDMSLSEYHRCRVGPGLVWESGNGVNGAGVAPPPPPQVTQGTADFFRSADTVTGQLPTASVPAEETPPVQAGGAAAAAEGGPAAQGGGTGQGQVQHMHNHDDAYARVPNGFIPRQTKDPQGFFTGLWRGVKSMWEGGSASDAAAAQPLSREQAHFAYGVGDIVGLQWDGEGGVSLVRNGVIVGRARLWPAGQQAAAQHSDLQTAVARGGSAALPWPERLQFVLISTAGCEAEIVTHREIVARQRRADGTGQFEAAYYGAYGPMPAHEGDLYPERAVRSICQ